MLWLSPTMNSPETFISRMNHSSKDFGQIFPTIIAIMSQKPIKNL